MTFQWHYLRIEQGHLRLIPMKANDQLAALKRDPHFRHCRQNRAEPLGVNKEGLSRKRVDNLEILCHDGMNART